MQALLWHRGMLHSEDSRTSFLFEMFMTERPGTICLNNVKRAILFLINGGGLWGLLYRIQQFYFSWYNR